MLCHLIQVAASVTCLCQPDLRRGNDMWSCDGGGRLMMATGSSYAGLQGQCYAMALVALCDTWSRGDIGFESLAS